MHGGCHFSGKINDGTVLFETVRNVKGGVVSKGIAKINTMKKLSIYYFESKEDRFKTQSGIHERTDFTISS